VQVKLYTAINLFYGTIKYDVTREWCGEGLIKKEHMVTNLNLTLKMALYSNILAIKLLLNSTNSYYAKMISL